MFDLRTWLGALALCSLTLACGDGAADGDAGPVSDGSTPSADAGPELTISDVTITDNDNSVLSCLVSFTTNLPATAAVEFGKTGNYSFRVRGDDELATSHTVLVIGLYADSEYQLRATAEAADSQTATSADLTYTTGPLPSSVWRGKVETHDSELTSTGWTLTDGCAGPPTAVMFDMSGEPVWYYVFVTELAAPAGITATFDPATNHVIIGPGTMELDALEVDLAGNIVWVGPRGSADGAHHHEFKKLADGNYVTLLRKEVDGVKGDVIAIYNSDKEVVWSWNAFDYLDPPAEPTTTNWLHANAVTVDTVNGYVYLSARALDTIFKIDYASKAIIWELGPTGDFTNPTPSSSWFDAQHDPEIQPDGSILVYDNNPGAGATRAIELQIDEDAMTASTTWEFPGTAEVDAWYTDSWFTPIWGGVQRLANGNTLIAAGNRNETPISRIFEVTSEGTVVWEMELSPHGSTSYSIYRASRLPALVESL
jgi:hypothetical protein